MKAFFVGLLHVASTLTGPDPSFPKPTIDRVRIVGDTVWFEGTRGFDSVRTRYCFVRRAGNWCRLPQAASGAPASEPMPRSPRDSIVLAPNLTIVCRPSDNWPSSCDTFGVLSGTDRRVHWLIPHATEATRVTLQRAIHLETEDLPAMSTFVTAHVVDERSIWFGLAGGFPEGDGAFGGLLRFDRQRRTVETVTHPKLAGASVTGLAIDGDALWVGTLHPGEYGPWGSTGVMRRDLRSGRWTRLDSATTELPDDLIQTLAAADGSLYVATGDGLAAFDAKSGRWSVRYFRRTIIADSIVYALATARPADEAADEQLFVVMEQLHVKRRGAFVATMRQIGLERLNPNAAATGTASESALAHPALMPFLVEALAVPDAANLAASALAEIGDRQAAPALRLALSRAAETDAVWIAAALARLGDSAGLAWLHNQLMSGRSSLTRRYAMAALERLRDTASVAPILSVLVRDPDEAMRRLAAATLGAYAAPAVWRRMVDTARGVADMPRILVDVADSVALRDSTVAAALGDWAIALLDTAGRGPRPYAAFRLAAQLRPYDAVPAIMGVFAADERWAASAAPELVRLTGIDTAPPVFPRRDEGRRLAWEFWTAWWRTNATRYTVVSREVGERAYRRWMERVIARERLEYQRDAGRRG